MFLLIQNYLPDEALHQLISRNLQCEICGRKIEYLSGKEFKNFFYDFEFYTDKFYKINFKNKKTSSTDVVGSINHSYRNENIGHVCKYLSKIYNWTSTYANIVFNRLINN